jgi:hypothetical protein
MLPGVMKTPRWHPSFWFILTAALLLRLAALPLFPYPTGDVNLFCLAAGHFAEQGRLDMGFKNHFAPEMQRFGLNEPQSQHLPLWPLAGGLVKKILPGADAYRIFQAGSLLAGLVLLILLEALCRRLLPPWAVFCAVTLAAGSPLLIEHSVNGSFYILLPCQWLGVLLLLPELKKEGYRAPLALGLLIGLSMLTHFTQVFLVAPVIMYLIRHRNRIVFRGAAIALLLAAACWIPWALRNQALFGSPLYSSTTLNFQRKWGLLETKVAEGKLVQIPHGIMEARLLPRLLLAAPRNFWRFMGMLASACLLWPLLLSVPGWLLRLKDEVPARRAKETGAAFIAWPALGLTALYLADIALWGFIRPRFLTPLLPLVFLWTAWALATAVSRSNAPRRWVIASCAVCILTAALLTASAFYQWKKTTAQDHNHAAAQKLALWLKDQPGGVVLGYSRILDGGIEGIRLHDKPYVHGRNFIGHPWATEYLMRQYRPDYIWCDETTSRMLQSWGQFRVLRQKNGLRVIAPAR